MENENLVPQAERTLDMRLTPEVLFSLFKKYVILILICAIACGALAAAYTVATISVTYVATSKLYVVSSSGSSISLSDLSLSSSLTRDFIDLMTDQSFFEIVTENLELETHGYSWQSLQKMVSVTNPEGTHLLNITVKAKDPQLAMDIANELADVSVIQLAAIMVTSQPKVVRYSKSYTSYTDKNLAQNTMIGLFVGAAAVYAIGLLLYILDDTIKTDEDVEKYVGMNVIGIVSDAKLSNRYSYSYGGFGGSSVYASGAYYGKTELAGKGERK